MLPPFELFAFERKIQDTHTREHYAGQFVGYLEKNSARNLRVFFYKWKLAANYLLSFHIKAIKVPNMKRS